MTFNLVVQLGYQQCSFLIANFLAQHVRKCYRVLAQWYKLYRAKIFPGYALIQMPNFLIYSVFQLQSGSFLSDSGAEQINRCINGPPTVIQDQHWGKKMENLVNKVHKKHRGGGGNNNPLTLYNPRVQPFTLLSVVKVCKM